jgi:hypothetical protein
MSDTYGGYSKRDLKSWIRQNGGKRDPPTIKQVRVDEDAPPAWAFAFAFGSLEEAISAVGYMPEEMDDPDSREPTKEEISSYSDAELLDWVEIIDSELPEGEEPDDIQYCKDHDRSPHYRAYYNNFGNWACVMDDYRKRKEQQPDYIDTPDAGNDE